MKLGAIYHILSKYQYARIIWSFRLFPCMRPHSQTPARLNLPDLPGDPSRAGYALPVFTAVPSFGLRNLVWDLGIEPLNGQGTSSWRTRFWRAGTRTTAVGLGFFVAARAVVKKLVAFTASPRHVTTPHRTYSLNNEMLRPKAESNWPQDASSKRETHAWGLRAQLADLWVARQKGHGAQHMSCCLTSLHSRTKCGPACCLSLLEFATACSRRQKLHSQA